MKLKMKGESLKWTLVEVESGYSLISVFRYLGLLRENLPILVANSITNNWDGKIEEVKL